MLLRPLDQQPPLPGCDALAVAAAVAAALADLHDTGLVHGSLGPDCVLLDDSGAVSLLPAVEAIDQVEASDDVAALGRLLRWLAERAADGPAHSRSGLLRVPHPVELLGELADRCLAASPGDRPSPRLVADTLHRRMPHARRAESLRLPPRRRPLVGRRAVLGAVVAALAGGALVAPSQCTASSPPAVAIARQREPAQEPASWEGGVLTIGIRRYAVGDADDQVLLRRWACGPEAVALLRRPDGAVVAFDRLPHHAQPAVGRVLARVPGAVRLVTRRSHDGCTALAVATADGRTVPLEWKEAS